MGRRSLVRARSKPRRHAPPEAVVSEDWRRWVIDNLLRGVDPDDLVDGLAQGGVPGLLARQTVAALRRSPGLASARAQRRWAERLEQVMRLCGTAVRERLRIDRVPAPTAEELFARYWRACTPVIFTDIVPRWRRQWTPEHLRERFGQVRIEACIGREGNDAPDVHWKELRAELTLAEYVDRMLAVPRSNDLYLIANNRNTARPELRALWSDVVLPPGWFDEPRLPGGSALWLGPAGTSTPLHHDTSNILFCQIHGRKRVVLAPPWSLPLLATARGVYNDRGAAEAIDEGIEVLDLVVEPGEALFIPVGWWHDVQALDVSVSLAINAFARDNAYAWYKPGSVR